jgi:hypothetical protein
MVGGSYQGARIGVEPEITGLTALVPSLNKPQVAVKVGVHSAMLREMRSASWMQA